MKKIIINFIKSTLLVALFSSYTVDIKANAAKNFFKYIWNTSKDYIDSTTIASASLVLVVWNFVDWTEYWYSSAEDKLSLVKTALQYIKDHPKGSAKVAILFGLALAFKTTKTQKEKSPDSSSKKEKPKPMPPIATIYTGSGKQ